MLRDLTIFDAVADAVACFGVPLMTLAMSDNEKLLDIADKYELPLLFEAFADRTYLSNGELAPAQCQVRCCLRRRDSRSSKTNRSVRKSSNHRWMSNPNRG